MLTLKQSKGEDKVKWGFQFRLEANSSFLGNCYLIKDQNKKEWIKCASIWKKKKLCQVKKTEKAEALRQEHAWRVTRMPVWLEQSSWLKWSKRCWEQASFCSNPCEWWWWLRSGWQWSEQNGQWNKTGQRIAISKIMVN